MSQTTVEIQKCDLSNIIAGIYTDNVLQVRDAAFYDQFTRNEIMYLMLIKAVYVIPTTELIDWLRDNIIGTAIEIGAGHGAIGRALGIPITDSYMQALPEIQVQYKMIGQEPITYLPDVEKLEALEAVEKYKPQTVIGAFITHRWLPGMNNGNMYGPNEELMMTKIRRYINIGNLVTHKAKPLLDVPHQQYHPSWLITRAIHQEYNRIFIFENEHYDATYQD